MLPWHDSITARIPASGKYSFGVWVVRQNRRRVVRVPGLACEQSASQLCFGMNTSGLVVALGWTRNELAKIITSPDAMVAVASGLMRGARPLNEVHHILGIYIPNRKNWEGRLEMYEERGNARFGIPLEFPTIECTGWT